MSQTKDSRHQRRVELVQALFAASFEGFNLSAADQKHHQHIEELWQNVAELDTQISQVAPERPVSQINHLDKTILRLILFEGKKSTTPPKVLINEAVELAKEFQANPGFINGVLGKLLIDK